MSFIVEMIILFLVLCLILSGYFIYIEKHKNKTKISFKESLDLVGIPVITFYQGNNKFNFILDSGASNCVINEYCLKDLQYENCKELSEIFGYDGIKSVKNNVKIKIYFKNNIFESDFVAMDMREAFNSIKKDHGVTIHGILGSDFLSKYKYIMDYSDNIAYIK